LSLRRHFDSAFSLGTGYERTPPGSFVANHAVAGYYLDFREKTVSAFAADPASRLPVTVAQLALGWWERHLAGEGGARARFEEMVELLRASATYEDGRALWLHTVVDWKYELELPYISGLAQGQAASVFVRAHLLGGRDEDAELAVAAAAPLIERDGWTVVADTELGPGLEEAPTSPPSLILNGWVYALWALRDLALGLSHEGARTMLAGSTECLTRTLPSYDVGWWTRYSLYPHALPDLAKPFYHRLHVWQAEMMARLTGRSEFAAAAARWRNYDTPVRRVAAVAQKAAFVASRYR
jgi:heparosan-N-sulfate-glucuronate 5-epimerase